MGESGFGNSNLPGQSCLSVNPVISPKRILIPFGSVDEVNNSWLVVNYFVKQQRIIWDVDLRPRG
mgnify:CR=1 FL=1